MSGMDKPLVFYIDYQNGPEARIDFATAWVARRYFGKDGADYVPLSTLKECPEMVRGRNVWLMGTYCYSKALKHLTEIAASATFFGSAYNCSELALLKLPNFTIVYPQDKQPGSRLAVAWQFFFPGKPLHWLALYAGGGRLAVDLPNVDIVQTAIDSYPHDLAFWDMWALKDTVPSFLLTEGRAIRRAFDLNTANLCRGAEEMDMDGYRVPVQKDCWDRSTAMRVARKLAEGRPFACACYVAWRWGRAYRVWELYRTRESTVNIGEIARRRGGNGADFLASFSEPLSGPTAQAIIDADVLQYLKERLSRLGLAIVKQEQQSASS